jgi:flavin-dependent dehydrogenase
MQKPRKDRLVLQNGSRIGVVGGGPAGSFFTWFAFDFAEKAGISIEIDIYEPRDFSKTGNPGCNHCGGIVSESLVQMLKSDGIVLPPKVIRRVIESYTLQLESGKSVIESHATEQSIVSMFRGSGPSGQSGLNIQSFDGYLLELCTAKGAKIYTEKIIKAEREPDGVSLYTSKTSQKYDLVVGASGLNPKTLNIFSGIIPDFIPPKTAKTFISEYFLEPDKISKHFGNSMHVFLLNLPGIKFGALIPKGNFVTLVLLGSEINEKLVNQFLHSKTVKACFPEDSELKQINPCQCFPPINIKNAENPYTDRVILIGDSASSKLYKNGIGAAYITAKAAALTAISAGISKADFRKSYQPVCSKLNRDNEIGKLIFYGTSFIQKSAFLKSVLFRMVEKEQTLEKSKRDVSSLLWDTFTGSASYRNILFRSLNPVLIAKLMWNLLIQLTKTTPNS